MAKKTFFLQWALPLFSTLALTGCVTMQSVDSIDTTDSSEGIKWAQLEQSGVCEDASRNPWNGKIDAQGKTNYFLADTKQLVWWGYFKQTTFIASPVFTAKWYEPSGTVFHESTFSTKSWVDNQFYKGIFPFKELKAAEHAGEWKVEIVFQGKTIDRRKFFIGEFKPQEPPKPVQDEVKKESAESITKPVAASTAVPTAAANKALPKNSKYDADFKNATALFEGNKLTEAKLAFENILKEEPFRTEAHLALAAISFKQSKFDESLKELDYLMQNPEFRDRAMKMREMVLRAKNSPSKQNTESNKVLEAPAVPAVGK